MRIRSILVLLLVVTSVLWLSSCESTRFDPTDDKAIAEERLREIIEAINNNDKEAIKSMFSKEALQEADDIDSGIEYLMSIYRGKVISKDGATSGTETNNYGVKTAESSCFYTVKTDVDTYIVFFIDEVVDTENPDNVGLYMLQIIKKSDMDKYFDGGEGKSRCAGIFLPKDAYKESVVN